MLISARETILRKDDLGRYLLIPTKTTALSYSSAGGQLHVQYTGYWLL